MVAPVLVVLVVVVIVVVLVVLVVVMTGASADTSVAHAILSGALSLPWMTMERSATLLAPCRGSCTSTNMMRARCSLR